MQAPGFSAVVSNLLDFIKNVRWENEDTLSPKSVTVSEQLFEEEPESLKKNSILPYAFHQQKATFLWQLFKLDLLIMIVLSGLLSLLNIEDMGHAVMDMLDNPLLLLVLAVILAPVVEEAIFRLPIGPWWGRYFKIAFWFFTILFAAVHLTNFISGVSWWKAPLLVLPQFILGIILGYLRVGLGFWYSVLFHALHNGFLIGLTLLPSLFGIDIMETMGCLL